MFYNLILIFLLITSVEAKEPTMAILKNIYSNDIQQFTYQNYSFTCRPYGVVTLEDVYKATDVSTVCKKKIVKFYIQNPKLKYFSIRLLKLFQMYHIDVKKDLRCVIYAKGMKTLSELLIEKGLAIKKPYLKDEIFKYRFETAQKGASYHKRGLFKDPILKNCMIFYKEN